MLTRKEIKHRYNSSERGKATNKAYHQKYKVEHPDYCIRQRMVRIKSNRKRRKEAREAVLVLLGGKCANPNCRHLNEDGTLGCKETTLLQVDHPNNDGAKHRKERPAMGVYFDVLKAGGKGYQLLCSSCNWRKRMLMDTRTASL